MGRSTIRAATATSGAVSRTIATTRGTCGSTAAIATRATTTIVQTALASAASRTNTAKKEEIKDFGAFSTEVTSVLSGVQELFIINKT